MTARILSLRVAGQSRVLGIQAFRVEHKCDFWDSLAA
jgi:hypothetical protein